jgi:hypothetical protein
VPQSESLTAVLAQGMHSTDENYFKKLEVILPENDTLNKTGKTGLNIKTSQKLYLRKEPNLFSVSQMQASIQPLWVPEMQTVGSWQC